MINEEGNGDLSDEDAKWQFDAKGIVKGSQPPAGRLRARTILIAVVVTLLSGCRIGDSRAEGAGGGSGAILRIRHLAVA